MAALLISPCILHAYFAIKNICQKLICSSAAVSLPSVLIKESTAFALLLVAATPHVQIRGLCADKNGLPSLDTGHFTSFGLSYELKIKLLG